MCGISGALDWRVGPDVPSIHNMTRVLGHRGPDAEAFVTRGPLALGHRRLSIIDISEAGNQPMADVSGRFWIVFNGEIYNYREIKSELQAKGATFRTQTDTEVILEGLKAG